MTRDDAQSLSDDPGPIETGPVAKGTSGGSHYIIGNVTGGNIAIGNEAVARTAVKPEDLLNEALARLEEFNEVLTLHESEITDFNEIREAVLSVQAELSSRYPRRIVVRHLLGKIIAGVSGTTVLAELTIRFYEIIDLVPPVAPERGTRADEATSGDDKNRQ
jgi:hypothetical protein